MQQRLREPSVGCATLMPQFPLTYSATWDSVSRTRIGGINFVTTNAQSFLIPSVIPDTVTEVVLYIEIRAGYNQNGYCIIKIFTEESDDR